MTKQYCDACGVELPSAIGNIIWGRFWNAENAVDSLTLCKECYDAVVEFVAERAAGRE
jgi:hypothetical protein